MDYKLIILFVFLTIIVSMQYTMNRILVELKEIKKVLSQKKINT